MRFGKAHLTIFQQIRECLNHIRTHEGPPGTEACVERHPEGLAGFLLGLSTELFSARIMSCRLTHTLSSSSFPSVHPLIHFKGLHFHSSDDQPSPSCSHLTFVRLTVKCVRQQEPNSVRTLRFSMCNRVIKKHNIRIIYSGPKLGTAQVSVYRQQQKLHPRRWNVHTMKFYLAAKTREPQHRGTRCWVSRDRAEGYRAHASTARCGEGSTATLLHTARGPRMARTPLILACGRRYHEGKSSPFLGEQPLQGGLGGRRRSLSQAEAAAGAHTRQPLWRCACPSCTLSSSRVLTVLSPAPPLGVLPISPITAQRTGCR